MAEDVAHLVFDVESIADGELIASVRYPDDNLSPEEAVERYQNERLEQTGSTFIPHTFQVPIAVVIAKVTRDFRLVDIVSLDEPEFRPHVITKHFWMGWEMYKKPQWVTFNGRSFDIPIMEMSAYRFGIPLPRWFTGEGYKSPRNRFNTNAHLDLQELLTNFGAARLNGGLNLAAQMLGKPGKVGLSGDRVQSQYDEGKLTAISDYCRCDVLDTYFVFLRSMLLTGQLSLDAEQERITETKAWLEERAPECEAYRDYLSHWSDWKNPWIEPPPEESPETEETTNEDRSEIDQPATSETTATDDATTESAGLKADETTDIQVSEDAQETSDNASAINSNNDNTAANDTTAADETPKPSE